jgi:cytochrome c oxidase subunit 1
MSMRHGDETRAWLLLAVGALAVAGGLALVLAVSRAPGAEHWLPSGPDFFRRTLVTHVVFSFQVWLLAMLGALAATVAPARSPAWAWGGLLPAWGGCGLLLVPILTGGGEASLNNYVPVLIHPFFYLGLGLLAVGVVSVALRPLWRWRRMDAVGCGLAAAGSALAAALVSIVIASLDPTLGADPHLANERLFWGGGHILQFVNAILAMVGWLVASRRAFGAEAPPGWAVRGCFAALGLAAWVGPGLELAYDSADLVLRESFTRLFRVVLPLPPALMMIVTVGPWLRRRPCLDPVARRALLLSVAVFGLGGLAGFALGEGDTRTPSHYHAMIGGVNLALMGMIHLWLLPTAAGGWLGAQYWLYGGGQLLHAAGFYLAGVAGVARKTAGAAQGLDSALKLVSMGVVGLGGAIAVFGGVIFVVQSLSGFRAHPAQGADIVDPH